MRRHTLAMSFHRYVHEWEAMGRAVLENLTGAGSLAKTVFQRSAR